MPARRLALALGFVLLAGCAGSDSKTYAAPEVRDALRKHGFDVQLISQQGQRETTVELLNLFSGGAFEGVDDLVADRQPESRSGETVGGVVSAWILDSESRAAQHDCPSGNAFATCLRRRNVVVVVRSSRAEAAREALEDLN